MRRLSITVDPELLEEVLRLAKVRTKREAIEQALKEFVRHHRLQELQALAGSGLTEMDLEELGRWRQASIEHP
jgi:Arc/MetJ family transcription regulator